MANITYRADIDGLRGLAMFPILFMHAGLPLTPGGFISVDIFFVISGYLIIDIVRSQLAAGKFTLIDFMARRVRRIMPAAYVTVCCTLLGGWFLLGPTDYVELVRSAKWNVLFSANFFFWNQAGYWDTASQLKPLLHTWSLAVEEQFYFLLPLFMVATFRLRENSKIVLMALIALASFLASCWAVKYEPSGAYYLLYSRAWEILVGGLLTYLPRNDGSRRWVSELVGNTGLLVILILYFAYDHQMPFPGVAGLAPTLATAALIWGGPTNLGSRFLATPLMVYFGRMTYSWYLVHWPLIAFANYWYGDSLTLAQTIGILFLSFILAHLSRTYVEETFLAKKFLKTNRALFGTAISLVLAMVAVTQVIRVHEGFPSRLPQLSQQYHSALDRSDFEKRCSALLAAEVKQDKLCHLGKKPKEGHPQFITWGDSHNASLLPLYDSLADDYGLVGWHAARIACPPFPTLYRPEQNTCGAFNAAMLELIRRNGVKDVIVASRWGVFLHGSDKGDTYMVLKPPAGVSLEDYYRQVIESSVQAIRDTGARVWLVRQVPTFPFEPPKHLAVMAMKGQNTVGVGKPYEQHIKELAFTNQVLDEIVANDPGVHLIDPVPVLCADGKVCRAEQDGWSLYRDDNHVSTRGALALKPMMREFVDTLQKNGAAF